MPKIEAIAHHEAGHAVVEIMLELPVLTATIMPAHGMLGHVRMRLTRRRHVHQIAPEAGMRGRTPPAGALGTAVRRTRTALAPVTSRSTCADLVSGTRGSR